MLAIAGCGRGTGEKELTHEEVRAINERVLEKAIDQPDSALMMISSLRDTLPDYRCDYLRAKVYGQTLEGAWLDSAIIIGERLMTTDAAREDLAYRQDVLEMLIHACRQHRDDELTIHWSAQLIDLCRQNGDETEALRTEADLGLMLSGIGRADEGLAKIDSVITLLSGKRKFNELDATIIALKRKVNVLKNMSSGEFAIRQDGEGDLKSPTHGSRILGRAKRHPSGCRAANPAERIVESAQQMLDLMADYEQHPDEYHDGTYREPPEHLRPGYIDFYRAQAYMFMVEGLTPGSGEFAIRQDGVGDFKSPAHGSRIANSSEREAANSSEPTNPSEPALSPPLSSWRGAGGEAVGGETVGGEAPLPIFRCLGNLLDEGAVLLVDDAALVDDVGGEEHGQHGNDGDTGIHDAEIFCCCLVPLYLALLLGGMEAGGVEVCLALHQAVVKGGGEPIVGIVQTVGLSVTALGLGGHGTVAEDGGVLSADRVALLSQTRLLLVVDGQHLVVIAQEAIRRRKVLAG